MAEGSGGFNPPAGKCYLETSAGGSIRNLTASNASANLVPTWLPRNAASLSMERYCMYTFLLLIWLLWHLSASHFVRMKPEVSINALGLNAAVVDGDS